MASQKPKDEFCLLTLLISPSLIASLYQEKPVIAVPRISRPFTDRERYKESASYLVSSGDVLYMQCGIAKILDRILKYRSSTENKAGDEADAAARNTLYDDLCQWKSTLRCWTVDRPHLQRLSAMLQYVTFLSLESKYFSPSLDF